MFICLLGIPLVPVSLYLSIWNVASSKVKAGKMTCMRDMDNPSCVFHARHIHGFHHGRCIKGPCILFEHSHRMVPFGHGGSCEHVSQVSLSVISLQAPQNSRFAFKHGRKAPALLNKSRHCENQLYRLSFFIAS